MTSTASTNDASVEQATMPAAPARAAVASLRPSAHHRTSWPAETSAPPMPDPMAPGCSTPTRLIGLCRAAADLIDAREHPVVLAAHHRRLAVLALAFEAEVQRGAAVGALRGHGAALGLGDGR